MHLFQHCRLILISSALVEQAQTRSETGSYANQAQEIVRKFVNNADDKANVHERQLLEKIRKELDHARKKVDEAALALRDEKAALEVSDNSYHTRETLIRKLPGGSRKVYEGATALAIADVHSS